MPDPVHINLDGNIASALCAVINEIERRMPPLISEDVRMLQATHGLSPTDMAANILTREIFVFEHCLQKALIEMRKLIEDGRVIVPFEISDDLVRDVVRH